MPVPALVWVAAGAIVVLLACSAFFSSSETAIFSLPTGWIDEQERTGDARVAALAALRRDPHRLLVTILVGNNVVNVAISSLITVVLVSYLPPGVAVTAATLIASFVVLVFGEIVPKSYGLGNATRWALVVARPLATVERLLFPLVLAFDAITRRMSALLGGEQRIEGSYLDE